jgi:hypothetical protein
MNEILDAITSELVFPAIIAASVIAMLYAFFSDFDMQTVIASGGDGTGLSIVADHNADAECAKKLMAGSVSRCNI